MLRNVDPPGVGFNDPTPAEPVGGNTGTTVGEQRLNAYQRALDLWGSVLKSEVPIVVVGSFAGLPCTATGGTLAQAGALAIFANFPNAPLTDHWYGSSLANALAGEDLAPDDDDIVANFNGNLGQPNCISGPGFYYGFDHNVPAGGIDFINTFMHEVAHGLGFQNFANEASGGTPLGLPDVYMANTRDLTLGLQWNELDAAQIQASAIRNGRVVWSGDQVTTNQFRVLGPFVGIRLTGNVSREIGFATAAFGAPATAATLDGDLVAAVDGDGSQDPSDACGPLIGDYAGQVVLANRGNCAFVVKAANAQAAGAKALVIANNVPNAGAIGLGGADPNVVITAISISFEDGAAIRDGLPGVAIEFFTDPSRTAGAAEGLVRLFAPTTVSLGSSISHFDTTATPDLLMEPAISGGLRATENLDLTPSLMQDIGWQMEPLKIGNCITEAPNALANGDLLSVDVQTCISDGRNRGQRVTCVQELLKAKVADGLLSDAEKNSAGRCVAQGVR